MHTIDFLWFAYYWFRKNTKEIWKNTKKSEKYETNIKTQKNKKIKIPENYEEKQNIKIMKKYTKILKLRKNTKKYEKNTKKYEKKNRKTTKHS